MSVVFSAESFDGVLRRLQLALDASAIGIWEHNITTGDISWDSRLRDLYGIGPEAPVHWIDLVHPEDRAAAAQDFDRAHQSGTGYSSQFRVLLPDGQVRHLRSKAHYHLNDRGHAVLIGAEWDVTEDVLLHQQLQQQARQLEQSQRLAEHAASHDYLTGLANRRGIEHFLAAEAQTRTQSTSAVLNIDLDLFKAVNDRYGHAAGDLYLKNFASGLRQVAPAGSLVARIGGDEFVVLLRSASPASACLLAASIITMTDELTAQIGPDLGAASIGVSVGTQSWSQLMIQSDHALYQAKRAGRGRYFLFDAATPKSGSNPG